MNNNTNSFQIHFTKSLSLSSQLTGMVIVMVGFILVANNNNMTTMFKLQADALIHQIQVFKIDESCYLLEITRE